MKDFSKTWKSSKDPAKQRKYRTNAPLHIKRKLVSSTLSKDNREKFNKRSAPVVKGDKVKVMRGSFRGKTGTVTATFVKRGFVHVDVCHMVKKSGAKSYYPMNASNLMITELNLKDGKRETSLKSDAKVQKTTAKASSPKVKAETAKPAEKKAKPAKSKEE
jgi:large subunit ribosomal protein L24